MRLAPALIVEAGAASAIDLRQRDGRYGTHDEPRLQESHAAQRGFA
jgi:hypothetical protein